MSIQRILWPTETPTALRAALDKFASEVQRYVGVLPNVDSLPASGDFTGQTLLNTTDNTAYMWNSTEWIQLVDLTWLGVKVLDAQMEGVAASKITGQLTNAQIEGIEAAKLTTQITETQIADDAITTPKIAAGAVTTNEIAANTIVANNIQAYAITGNEIAGNTITAAKIAAGAIGAAELAAGNIAGSHIAAYTIEAGNIAANTITAAQIASNAITTDKLVVTNFTNHIPNWNFATGDLINWSPWDGSGYISVVTRGTAGVPANAPSEYVCKLAASGTYTSIFSHEKSYNESGAETDGIQCQPGEQYNVTFYAAKDASYAATSTYARFHYRKTDGSLADYVSLGTVSLTTSWQEFSASLTIPADAVTGWLFFETSGFTAGAWYLTNVRCRRMSGGELIVDGAITATKISVGTLSAITGNMGLLTAGTLGASTVYAGDLNANQVTTGTLGANVIYTGTLAANKITAGTLNSGVLNTGTMNANLITAGTLGASVLYAGSLNANQVTTGTLGANVIYAGTILASQIGATTLSAITASMGNLTAGTISGGYISGGTVNAGVLTIGTLPIQRLATYSVTNLYLGTGSGGCGSLNIQSGVIGNAHIDVLDASNITTGTLGANVIYTGTLAANKIVAGTLNSGVLNTGTMNANLITAGTLGASVIYTGTLAANKIVAGTLNSGVINTGTMSAGLIVAGTMAADRIYGGAIGACSLAAGTIVAGQINTLDLNVAGRFRSNNGSMLTVAGAYLSSGQTTQYPGTGNFTDDGQLHVYNWTGASWYENCRIGNGVYDTDNVTAYFVNKSSNQTVVEAWKTGGGYGAAFSGYNTTGTGYGVLAWGPTGLYAYGTPAIYGQGASGGVGARFVKGSGGAAALVIGADAAATNPTHTAEKGSLWVTSEGHLWINTNGSTTWGEVYPAPSPPVDPDVCATVVVGGASGSNTYGDQTHLHIASAEVTGTITVYYFDGTNARTDNRISWSTGVSGNQTISIQQMTSGHVSRYSVNLTLGAGTHTVIASWGNVTDGGGGYMSHIHAHAIRTA